MATLTLQNMKSVLNHVEDLATLLNVNEDRKWLEQFLSSNEIEECINFGNTNLERTEALCLKLVTNKSRSLFNGLCELLMQRQKRFMHIYNVFTDGKCDTSCDHSHSKSESNVHASTSAFQETLTQLQTKIKDIDEELQHWRSVALKQTPNASQNVPPTTEFPSNFNPIFYPKPPQQKEPTSVFYPYTQEMVKMLETHNYTDWKFKKQYDEEDGIKFRWEPKLTAWNTILLVSRVGMDLGLWYSLILPAKTGRHLFIVRLLMYGSTMEVYTWHHTKKLALQDDAFIELEYSLKLEVPLFKDKPDAKSQSWKYEKDGKLRLEFFETLCLKVCNIPWGMFSNEELPTLTLHLKE